MPYHRCPDWIQPEELLSAAITFPLGIQLHRVPRLCWIQYIALLVSAEVKKHFYTVCSQCILGACSVSMRSFWLEQVEEHQVRVVEVWAALADVICSCSVPGFSLAGRIQVFTSAGACQRAQSWVNHGAKRLLVTKLLKEIEWLQRLNWEEVDLPGEWEQRMR